MGKFSINELMNDPRKKDAPQAQGENNRAFKIIPIDDIVPSPNNKYGIRDIEEMAANIEMVGLLHNLTVRETSTAGKYEIVSGERRYRALKMLADDGNAQYSAVPCMVEIQKDALIAELELLFANALARDLTDYEKTYQAGRIKEILQELKGRGHKFKGRMREVVAELLKVSPAQVGRMESINKNLAPEVKTEFEKGNINITAAYEASRLPQEQQAQVLNDMKQSGKADVKGIKEKRERVTPPAPVETPPPASLPYTEPPKPIDTKREAIARELYAAANDLEEWSDARADDIAVLCRNAATLILEGEK